MHSKEHLILGLKYQPVSKEWTRIKQKFLTYINIVFPKDRSDNQDKYTKFHYTDKCILCTTIQKVILVRAHF